MRFILGEIDCREVCPQGCAEGRLNQALLLQDHIPDVTVHFEEGTTGCAVFKRKRSACVAL